MSDNKRLIKTLIISGMAAMLSYLINYFLTAFITENVGVEAYGFVSIAKTAVSYAQIITIALTNFTVRYISVSYHEGKPDEAKGYFSSSVVASFVLASVIFLVALIAIFQLQYVLIIPEHLVESVKILFVLVFINFIVTTVQTPFSAAAVIRNRLDIVGLFKIVSYLLDAAVLIVLFYCFNPLVWFVGVGSLTASLVTFSCNTVLTKRLTPELKVEYKRVSINKIKNIISHGIYNSINSLGNVLNSGLDLIISNQLLTAVETGQIAVVKTIEGIFTLMNAMLFQSLQPKLIEAYVSRDINTFIRQLQKSMMICGYFTNTLFAGFFSLGMLYYKMWLPNQDYSLLYQLTVIATLMYVTEGIMKPVYYVNTLTLKNKIPCFVTVFSGFVNVASMYLLLKYTNLRSFAVVGTTSIIMLTLNIIFHPLYAAWSLNVSPKPIYRILYRQLFSAGMMTLVFLVIAKLVAPTGWGGLIGVALLMAIVGLFIHILCVCTRKEIKEILRKCDKE